MRQRGSSIVFYFITAVCSVWRHHRFLALGTSGMYRPGELLHHICYHCHPTHHIPSGDAVSLLCTIMVSYQSVKNNKWPLAVTQRSMCTYRCFDRFDMSDNHDARQRRSALRATGFKIVPFNISTSINISCDHQSVNS
jgi:hypothetical protein